jgi:hypothetical protein
MATAAGLGCSREERRLGFYRQCALARGIMTITHVKGWHGKAMARHDMTASGSAGVARRTYGGVAVGWWRRSVPRGP